MEEPKICQHFANSSTQLFVEDDRYYCVGCLWEETKDYEPVIIGMDKMPTLEQIFWDGDITPSDVLSDPEHPNHQRHYQRIIDADLSYPIHITFEGPYTIILDGCHRFTKAKLLSYTEVRCIIVDSQIFHKFGNFVLEAKNDTTKKEPDDCLPPAPTSRYSLTV